MNFILSSVIIFRGSIEFDPVNQQFNFTGLQILDGKGFLWNETNTKFANYTIINSKTGKFTSLNVILEFNNNSFNKFYLDVARLDAG